MLLTDNAHIFGHRLISPNRAIFINGNRVGPCWYVDGFFSAWDMQLKRDGLALRDGGDDLAAGFDFVGHYSITLKVATTEPLRRSALRVDLLKKNQVLLP